MASNDILCRFWQFTWKFAFALKHHWWERLQLAVMKTRRGTPPLTTYGTTEYFTFVWNEGRACLMRIFGYSLSECAVRAFITTLQWRSILACMDSAINVYIPTEGWLTAGIAFLLANQGNKQQWQHSSVSKKDGKLQPYSINHQRYHRSRISLLHYMLQLY